MIEVLALASSVSTIAGGISTAIKAGRDVSDLLPHFGRLARLDAEIQAAESGKHKGPLGRLTTSEEEGFAIAQAKMKHKEATDMLRETCQLFGPPGMWALVQKGTGCCKKKTTGSPGSRSQSKRPDVLGHLLCPWRPSVFWRLLPHVLGSMGGLQMVTSIGSTPNIQPLIELQRTRDDLRDDMRERWVEQKHVEAHELERLLDVQRLTRDWSYDQIKKRTASTGLIVNIEV